MLFEFPCMLETEEPATEEDTDVREEGVCMLLAVVDEILRYGLLSYDELPALFNVEVDPELI